jgi:cytochrome c-type biogenesis protein CcmE
MKHKALKVVLTTAVLVTAFGGLLYTSLGEATEYYKHVDEVMVQPGDWYGKNLQLHGFVVKDSILRRKNSLDYKFKVEQNGHVVDATYTGIVPDTFKDDAEVVLKGTLSSDGFAVHPNGVMAKCPSKYDPKTAAAAGTTTGPN